MKRKQQTHRAHDAGKTGGDLDELAAQLAPPEEQNKARAAQSGARNNGGAIVVDTGKLKLPEALADEAAKRAAILGLEPVVVVILAVALAFIAFIAWQIARTGQPPAGPPPAQVQRQG